MLDYKEKLPEYINESDSFGLILVGKLTNFSLLWFVRLTPVRYGGEF
jgi:hypothetical protein